MAREAKHFQGKTYEKRKGPTCPEAARFTISVTGVLQDNVTWKIFSKAAPWGGLSLLTM
jgi:hypothetical protein